MDETIEHEDRSRWMEESAATPSSLLCCAFNQDGGCLAIGTTGGFAIHNLHPHQVSVQRDLHGGIGLVEMLFRCNLIALVGGGPSPHAPSHRVLIWDDHVQKAIGELSFRQVVLRVKLRRDAIAVALRDRVYIYHLADLSLRDKIYTADNPYGLLCLSTAVQDMILACPSVTEGHVRVELYGLRKTVLMEAHESGLRGLALTADGTRLATASVKGTVIRVWDVSTSSCLQEFRRGVERVNITCLAWSWDYSWLACTSDKGTAHVFSVDSKEPKHKDTKSFGQRLFTSVRRSLDRDIPKSVSQIRGIPHPQACAFLPDQPHTLAVVGWDSDGNGVLSLSDFSQEEATRIAYHVVSKAAAPQEISEGTRRRRRMMGGSGIPDPLTSPEQGGTLYVGERVQLFEKNMREITFAEDGENGFVSVSTTPMSKDLDHPDDDADEIDSPKDPASL